MKKHASNAATKHEVQPKPGQATPAGQAPRTPRPVAAPKVHQKAHAGHAESHAGPQDRLSFSEERAENEGMVPSGPQQAGSELEGEGSYTAARRYDDGVVNSVAKGDTEELADEAVEALDGAEGPELRRAEEAAKHGQSTTGKQPR